MHEKNSTDGIAESFDRAGGWIKLCYRASHVDKYTEEDNYEFLRWIVFRANKGGNVTIDVHGQENIPKQDGFMFFQIIKACMMYWQLLKRVRTLFLL